MSFVEVDYDVLGSTVGSAWNCASTLESQKNAANSEMDNLKSSWQGQDATDFFSKWEETKGGDSTYSKLKYAIESYARYVDYCKAQYKYTQDNAVNRANWII